MRIKATTQHGDGEAGFLVRIRNINDNSCFHVAVYPDQPDTVDVLCAGPSYRIVDLEHQAYVTDTKKEKAVESNFKKAVSRKSTQPQGQKTLMLVEEFPFRTAQELAHKINPDALSFEAIHKRLPELLRKGKLVNGNTRRCTVTHKLAKTWAIASAPTEGAVS